MQSPAIKRQLEQVAYPDFMQPDVFFQYAYPLARVAKSYELISQETLDLARKYQEQAKNPPGARPEDYVSSMGDFRGTIYAKHSTQC